MQKYKCFFTKMTGCLMVTVLLLCGCAGKNDLEIVTGLEEAAPEVSGQAEPLQESGAQETGGSEPAQISGTAEESPIYVQVTGAVKQPGVYELPKGARVFEAIEKAGGMTEDAKAESINQALEVSDGDMIVLYTQQEWQQMQAGTGADEPAQSASSGSEDDGRININTASLEQLCGISGIGQSRAQSIITYREQNGAFGSIEEIMKVSGIKEGLFQKIKDKIKV
ncbi:MAG: helix-hairpin-helix domain-containing protein [Lachnospiraceae bacterium]|nr:helix-hairpin-helix domain-containing protein [Lachnospiraceae bacterium]